MVRDKQIDQLLNFSKWLEEKYKQTRATEKELNDARKYVARLMFAHDYISDHTKQTKKIGALLIAKIYELRSRINDLEAELEGRNGSE